MKSFVSIVLLFTFRTFSPQFIVSNYFILYPLHTHASTHTHEHTHTHTHTHTHSKAIYEVPPKGLQIWRDEVECVRRVLLTPALNVCLLVMLHLLLLQSGDVESNPGPFGEFVY